MNLTARIAVLASALAASACGAKDPGGPAARPAPRSYRVAVQPVEPRSLAYAVDAVGSVEAYDVVAVPARVSGTLDSLGFDEGDTVALGQVMAVVDGRRYSLELDQSKAAVASAEASVGTAKARTSQAQAALEEAETNLARRRGLREKNAGWVSEDEISTLETAGARSRASLEEARAGERVAAALVEERRAALAIAGMNAGDARILPPIAGTIEKRLVSAGQYVKAGDAVATLVDVSRLRVRFRVGEAESVRLRKGQRVEFSVAAFPGRTFRAALFHVNATADPVTRMVECLAEVEEPGGGLRPGFFASVSAEVSRSDAAIVVPDSSILPTDRGFVCFVVVDGKARERPVKPGLHTKDGGVEVIGGLAKGESLVVEGAGALAEGVPVEVVAPAAGKPPPGGVRRDGKE